MAHFLMDQDKIHEFEKEFGTGKVTLGAFVRALEVVTEALDGIGGGGGTPTDLTEVERLLRIIARRQRQTRDAVESALPLLERIAIATESIDLKTKGKK